MSPDFIVKTLGEHGPWVVLVFFLLWRDHQKDVATREALNKNTAVLIELATLLRATVGIGK